jgi:hypothetical protein
VGQAVIDGQLANAWNPSELRGAIELGSNPKGSLLLLSIDLPLAGKFDGLPDQIFILLDGTAFSGSGRSLVIRERRSPIQPTQRRRR